jgi:hypothetical protein
MAAADIFGDAAQDDAGKKQEPRIMLKKADSVATKAFDPWGKSAITDMDLAAVWSKVEKGDKWARFFSELAAGADHGGDYRVGIGLSRFAGLCVEVGKELKTNANLRKCLQPKVIEKAVEEFDTLEVHFNRLNAGKDFLNEKQSKEETFGGAKKRRLNQPDGVAAPPTARELEESAGALFAWLQKGLSSNFRMLAAIIGNGGVFYAFEAMDKTARAWVQHHHPPVTGATVVRAVTARHVRRSERPASSSVVEVPTGGLFDD